MTAPAPAAGIIGLTHGTGLVSSAIRVGQRLRFPASDSRYNHAFILVDDHRLIEMGGHGAGIRPIADYASTDHLLLDAGPADIDFAYWALEHHTHYGYTTIASLALSLATGAALEFGTRGTMICSGLVAACLNVAEWRADPSHVMPAELHGRFAPRTA